MNTKVRQMVNDRVKLVKASELDRDRVRFNWGYHDAKFDFDHYGGASPIRPEHWELTHYDSVYVEGWRIGLAEAKAGTHQQTSEPAWIATQRRDIITPYRY